MNKLKKLLLKYFYLFIIIAASIFYLGETLFPGSDQIIYGGDLLTQFYFWKGYLRDSISSGFIPFWNPYIYSGTPFLAHPGTSFFYPFTLFNILLPFNSSFSWIFLFHLIIAGVGMFKLCRQYCGKIESLGGSLVFIFSGYFAARIYAGHIDLFTTSVWIPWIMLYTKKLLEKGTIKTDYLLFILFYSLLILAGYSAYLVFTVLFISLFSIFRLFISVSKIEVFWKFTKIFIAIIVSLAITSISWLPTWQLTQNSIRGEGLPYDLASWGSLPVSGLKLFWNPLNRTELNKISFNIGGGPQPNPFDHYPGRIMVLVVFILFTYYLFRLFTVKKNEKLRINNDLWGYIAISLFFLFVSFGSSVTPSLHFLLYKIIHFYKFIRIPIQNLIIPVVILPLIFAIFLQQIRNIYVKLIVIFICILELFLFDKKYIFLTQVPELNYDKKLISDISISGNISRTHPSYRVISSILPKFDLNAPMKFKVYSTTGYDPVILKKYYEFVDITNGSKQSSILQYNVEIPPIDSNSQFLDFMNIGNIISEKYETYGGSYKQVRSTDFYNLYRSQDVFGRFYFAKSIINSDTKEKLRDEFIREKYNLKDAILYYGRMWDELKNTDIGCTDNQRSIKVISHTPNNIKLSVNNNCDSILGSSEVYYPGWRVKIDNIEKDIYLSNFAFRSIFIPKGNHVIEYYYFPGIYIIGGVMSLIGITITLIFCRLKRVCL